MAEPTKTGLTDVLIAADALRAATRAAIGPRVRADDGARACARTLGLDKSLGWKIHQIAFCTELVEALSAMPGARGWEIALQAFGTAGCDAESVARARAAYLAFESALADHRIDRKTLAGMVAALADNDAGRRQILRMRKDATESIALLYGVHMLARIGAYVAMPSKTREGFVDLAALTVLDGIERRRPGKPWPLYTPMFLHASGTLAAKFGAALALDHASDPRLGAIVRGLSSPDLRSDEIAPTVVPGSRAIDFVAKSPDRGAPLRLAFAEVMAAAGSAYASPGDEEVYMGMPPGTPCDIAVFDVLVHRGLPRGGELHSRYSLRQVSPSATADDVRGAMHPNYELPVDAGIVRADSLRLTGMLASTSTTYEALVGRAIEACGHELGEFDIFRTIVEYPPVPGMMITSWRLAPPKR
ncbi:MAG: hypothetical protein ACKOYN_06020 [Planctomycetota bacterium]